MTRYEPGRADDGKYGPDPVSVDFEVTAKRLLGRAFQQPGQWVVVGLIDPDKKQRGYWKSRGIDLDGADPVPPGGLNARTRWARALVRAIYRVNKHEGNGDRSITVEVGRHIPASPQWDAANPRAGGFPPRRQFRIMYQPDKAKARRHMRRQPDTARAVDDQGRPTSHWSDPNNPKQRDW